MRTPLNAIRDWPIRRKIVLLTMFSSATALLIAAVELIVYDVVQSRLALENQLTTTAAVTADNVMSAVSFSDTEAASESLQALGSNDNVVNACVYKEMQLLGAFSRSSEITCPETDVESDQLTYTFNRLKISRAITAPDGQRIGTLVVQVTTLPLRNRLRRDLLNIALVTLFAAGLAFLLSSRLQRWISNPLLQLTALTRSVSGTKDYSLRATRQANDELGVLVDAVNNMLAEIQAHQTEREAAAREREELLEREQQLRKAAEEASRIKDEFLATLSHELRTPLTSVVGWATLISARGLPAEKLQTGIQAIERNAKAQARLIEDLLDVSRITAGKFRLERSHIVFSDLVATALDVVAPIAEARRIRLIASFSDSPAQLQGDPARLQQAIGNILDNAIKFTPPGGQVSINIDVEDAAIKFTVSDTGIGIAPEFLPFVFDRLRQADGSSTRKFGGLGIGLTIARHIIELHGGSIAVVSQGQNRGTTFTIHLPGDNSQLEPNALAM